MCIGTTESTFFKIIITLQPTIFFELNNALNYEFKLCKCYLYIISKH